VLTLWAWVASNSPSTGRLEGIAAEEILMICRCGAEQSDLVDILLSCGYLAKDANGVFYVPNWRTEQPFAAQAEERRQAARAKAEKRWGAKAEAHKIPVFCTSNATALQSECSNTNSNTNIKSPPTPPRGGESEIAPVSEIVALYREVLPELPKPREEAAKLGRDIEARWKSKPEARSLEWWRGYFEQVREYPYLMGEVEDWRAGLAWLVCRTNMDKVLAGHYVARSDMEPPKSRGMSNEEFEQMRAEQRAAAEAAGYLDPDMP